MQQGRGGTGDDMPCEMISPRGVLSKRLTDRGVAFEFRPHREFPLLRDRRVMSRVTINAGSNAIVGTRLEW
jgi:hypothetical protein